MAAPAATPQPDFASPLGEVAARRDLDTMLLLRVADAIAALHAQALPAGAAPSLASLAKSSEQRAELARLGDRIAARADAGRARRGHGALGLDTILIAGDVPRLTPGNGAEADVLFDLAALLAALWSRGLQIPASIVANRYADVAPQGATGWSLLPLFLSLHSIDPAAAMAFLAPAPPRLIAIGGLSGSGKTTLARQLAARFGRAPGARVLRSDVFRKRVMGLPPETRLPPAHYTRASDEETFAAMFESADDHLACGTSVILDAVFMSRSERDVAQFLAERRRVPFTAIWLEAPERDRIARVSARSGDASDAGADVVRDQSRRPVGELYGWHRIRTNRPIELIVAAARGALDRPGR